MDQKEREESNGTEKPKEKITSKPTTKNEPSAQKTVTSVSKSNINSKINDESKIDEKLSKDNKIGFLKNRVGVVNNNQETGSVTKQKNISSSSAIKNSTKDTSNKSIDTNKGKEDTVVKQQEKQQNDQKTSVKISTNSKTSEENNEDLLFV